MYLAINKNVYLFKEITMLKKMFSVLGLVFFTGLILNSCQEGNNPADANAGLSQQELNSTESLREAQ